MKHLPKHLRPRWRYLAVELESWPDTTVARRSLQRELWVAARTLLGDPGSADADLQLLSFSFADATGEAIVRVRHDEVARARAAIACVDAVDGDPIRVRIRGASGTIRGCEEKYMGGPTEKSIETRVAYRDGDRRALARGSLLDVEIDGGFTGAARLDVE